MLRLPPVHVVVSCIGACRYSPRLAEVRRPRIGRARHRLRSGGFKPESATTDPGAAAFPASISADQQITITFEDYNLASRGIGREATLKMLEIQSAPSEGDQRSADGLDCADRSGRWHHTQSRQLLLREGIRTSSLPVKTVSEIVPPDELRTHLGRPYPINANPLKLTTGRGKLLPLP